MDQEQEIQNELQARVDANKEDSMVVSRKEQQRLEKQKRLEANLRSNLRRRKAQSRQRSDKSA